MIIGHEFWKRAPSVRRVFALACLAAALPMLACDDGVFGSSCSLVDCGDSASSEVSIPVTAKDLEDARVEICRNESCAVARVYLQMDPGGGITVLCTPVAGGAEVNCMTSSQTATIGSPDSTQLRVSYHATFDEGDRFTLRVTDASAEQVYFEQESALHDFRWNQPNGDCDGDFACRVGAF